jgi:hypothetical protein
MMISDGRRIMQTFNKFLENCFKIKQFRNVDVKDESVDIQYCDEDGKFKDLSIQFDEGEIKPEYAEVKNIKQYHFSTNKTLNFILFDSLASMKDKNKIIENAICKIRLTKDIGDDVLIFNVFKHVADFDKINTAYEKILCSDIIKENVVAVYLEWKSEKEQIYDDIEVNKIINSLLIYLSIKEGIILENPYNMFKNSDIETALDVDFQLATDNEPVQYFLQAEKLDMPNFKYLEYYHILEYYFLHHKIQEIDGMIKELVAINMIQNDKGEDRSYYYKLGELYNYYSEDKDSNELNQLEYLIRNNLGFNIIRSILEKHFNDYKFLIESILNIQETVIQTEGVLEKKQKKKFLDKIGENEKNIFCNGIARRIYKIRNKIVHTKKYEKEDVFLPTQLNFDSLQNDLKLIRLLSYTLTTKK